MTQKKDGPPIYKLSRQIPIREITEAWLSPLVDNFVVLKVPSEFFDVILELEFKTELISWLCLKGALQASNVFFQDQIEYFKTKKSKNKIRFMRDEMFPESMYKKDKVSIKGGLPASSSVAQFSKQGELVQLVHVVKEEEKRPERKRERKRGANRYNDDVPAGLVGVAVGGTGGAGGPVAASPSPAAASPSPAGPGPAFVFFFFYYYYFLFYFISFYFILFHFISFHFISFHFIHSLISYLLIDVCGFL